MKGTNRYMKVILMTFAKKFLFKEMDHFGSENGNLGYENGTSSQLWICCKDCVTILYNERGKERHGNYINGFSEIKLIWSNLVIFAQKWCIFITFDLLQVCFFFKFCSRGLEVHENFISCFSRKKTHLGQFDLFRPFFTV